jgi:hypothetical protein
MSYKIETKTIQMDTPFTHNGIQYPANWIRLASEEDKSDIGLVWEDDPVRADDRFYWNGNINNPKALEDVTETVDGKEYTTKGLKSNFITQVKATAGSILAQTDWMVIRKAERNIDIPESIVEYRTAVIAKADELETSIQAVTTVEELINLNLSFPQNN